MKNFALWVAFLILALSLGVAEVSNKADKSGNKSDNVVEQIKLLAKQGKEATLKNDASWLEENTTSDYTAVLAVGGMLPRQQIIEERKSGHFKYDSIDVIEQRVREYGPAAILNETADIKATHNGHPIGGRYYVTQVWIKQGGAWKLANLQSTKAQH